MEVNGKVIAPYKGNEPYIFISYSHKNSNEALEIIERLQAENYRVWYDEGIDPGTEWDENIATHVEECEFFIALLSDEYIASSNCKDELNYARDLEKNRLLIYLNQVKLPSGMRMRLSRLQNIHKYTYTDENNFYNKLFEAVGIEKCKAKYIERKNIPSPVSTVGNKNAKAEITNKSETEKKGFFSFLIKNKEKAKVNNKEIFKLDESKITKGKNYTDAKKCSNSTLGDINDEAFYNIDDEISYNKAWRKYNERRHVINKFNSNQVDENRYIKDLSDFTKEGDAAILGKELFKILVANEALDASFVKECTDILENLAVKFLDYGVTDTLLKCKDYCIDNMYDFAITKIFTNALEANIEAFCMEKNNKYILPSSASSCLNEKKEYTIYKAYTAISDMSLRFFYTGTSLYIPSGIRYISKEALSKCYCSKVYISTGNEWYSCKNEKLYDKRLNRFFESTSNVKVFKYDEEK